MYIPSSELEQIRVMNFTEFGIQMLTQFQELNRNTVKGSELVSQEIAKASMNRNFYIGLASGGTTGVVFQLILLIRRRHFQLVKTLEFNALQQKAYEKVRDEWVLEKLAGTLIADSTKETPPRSPNITNGLSNARARDIVNQARGVSRDDRTQVETNQNGAIIDIYFETHAAHLRADFQHFQLPEREEMLARREILKCTAIKAMFSRESPIIVTNEEFEIFMGCFLLMLMGFFMSS